MIDAVLARFVELNIPITPANKFLQFKRQLLIAIDKGAKKQDMFKTVSRVEEVYETESCWEPILPKRKTKRKMVAYK